VNAQITQLIDRPDNLERVRDQIGAILLVEQENQQALAREAGKDPELWRLRIFSERSNPWEVFRDQDSEEEDEEFDRAPVINVTFDSESFDKSTGNTVERQTALGTFNVDCYAQAIAKDDPEGLGHEAGDEAAAKEAHRAARLVRSILMAGAYTYLGMRGVVGRRWVQSITVFQPQAGGQSIEHVVAARVAFQVEFNEFSPQVEGQLLELVSASVRRADNGQLLFAADYPISGA
jgi:hypothetical protein